LLIQPGGESAHPGGVESVAFFPDSGRFLSGGLDGVVRQWNVETGQMIDSFPTKQGRMVAVSTDGKRIVTGGLEMIQIWDAPGRLNREFMGEQGRLSCLAIGPDARLLATGEFELADPKLVLWDLTDPKKTFRFPNLTEPVVEVVFSPDGSRLLFAGGGFWKNDKWVGSDFAIRVWDVAKRKELRRLEGHTNTVGALAFAPGGKVALSGGRDGSLRLWNIDTGKELARADNTHEDGLRKAAFTPDGRLVVTSGTDGRIKLWALPTAAGEFREGPITEVADFATERHTNIVTSLAVSPDGRFAVSGSRDGTIRRWTLPKSRQP
jgi:WD40 repeat protein